MRPDEQSVDLAAVAADDVALERLRIVVSGGAPRDAVVWGDEDFEGEPDEVLRLLGLLALDVTTAADSSAGGPTAAHAATDARGVLRWRPSRRARAAHGGGSLDVLRRSAAPAEGSGSLNVVGRSAGPAHSSGSLNVVAASTTVVPDLAGRRRRPVARGVAAVAVAAGVLSVSGVAAASPASQLGGVRQAVARVVTRAVHALTPDRPGGSKPQHRAASAASAVRPHPAAPADSRSRAAARTVATLLGQAQADLAAGHPQPVPALLAAARRQLGVVLRSDGRAALAARLDVLQAALATDGRSGPGHGKATANGKADNSFNRKANGRDKVDGGGRSSASGQLKKTSALSSAAATDDTAVRSGSSPGSSQHRSGRQSRDSSGGGSSGGDSSGGGSSGSDTSSTD